jgi:uncharacterized YccA/Bax inhibitor family protein
LNNADEKRKPRKMTLRGVVLKSIFCLLLVSLTAAVSWKLFYDGVAIKWITTGGILVAIICSILISVKRSWVIPLTIIYALAKGLFIGGFSAYIHKNFPNLPFQAVVITLVTFMTMLLLYLTKIIKVTQKFKSVVIIVTTAIFVIYIVSFILNFFGIVISFLWSSSWIAITLNVVVAIFASLSLMLDFDYIDRYIGKANKSHE